MKPATVLAVCAILVYCPVTEGATKTDYNNLLTDLFSDYRREVRPVNDFSQATEVYLTFSLLSIVEVNEQDQTLKTNAQLDVEWYDDFLAWDETSYENISTLLLPQKSLWLPDIVVGNTVSSQKELGYDNLQVRLESDGYTIWSPSGVFETSCDIDITYYPFDTQVCSVVFQTAVSLQYEIYIYIDKERPIETGDFSTNGLWELLDSSAHNVDAEESRTKIEFKIQLRRRRVFYILNIILPVLFLSVTSSLTFALPADAGEKMGLSITILLAYAVYLTLVTDAMPSTSVQVSVLTVYLVILLALTAASVVLSVWILSYHHMPEDRPVKGCLVRLTLTLRKIFCMPPLEANIEDEVIDATPQFGRIQKGNAVAPFPDKQTAKDERPRNAAAVKNSVSPTVSGRTVAETFDKLIFTVFLSISIVTTVVCLLVLFVGAVKQEEKTRLTD